MPHLTLARCRAPADVSSLAGALAGYAGTPWAATEIHLIRSLPRRPAEIRGHRHLAAVRPPAAAAGLAGSR